jgi:hypothetical protein
MHQIISRFSLCVALLQSPLRFVFLFLCRFLFLFPFRIVFRIVVRILVRILLLSLLRSVSVAHAHKFRIVLFFPNRLISNDLESKERIRSQSRCLAIFTAPRLRMVVYLLRIAHLQGGRSLIFYEFPNRMGRCTEWAVKQVLLEFLLLFGSLGLGNLSTAECRHRRCFLLHIL